MKMTAAISLLLTLAAGTSACAISPPQVGVVVTPAAVWAPVPPPAPRFEAMPVAPGPNFFWVPGYWHWQGHHHHWIGGHWEAQRERHYWAPHRWDRDDHGRWRSSGGYWRRD